MKHIKFELALIPEKLYFGATKPLESLRSGFYETGRYVRSGPHANHYLYASDSRDRATVMGFLEALHERWRVRDCLVNGNTIELDLDSAQMPFPGLRSLASLPVHLHEIRPTAEQGWSVNHDAEPVFAREFRTIQTLYRPDYTCEQVDVGAWLQTKRIIFRILPHLSARQI